MLALQVLVYHLVDLTHSAARNELDDHITVSEPFARAKLIHGHRTDGKRGGGILIGLTQCRNYS